MAIGDKASAAGLAVFPENQDLRKGYENDNVRGDEIAQTRIDMTAGLGAKLDAARVRISETPMTTGTPVGTLRFW